MTRCAEACDQLLKECVARGAHDNLSALVIICGSKTSNSLNSLNPHTVRHAENSNSNKSNSEIPNFSKLSLSSPSSLNDGMTLLSGCRVSEFSNITPTRKIFTRFYPIPIQSSDEVISPSPSTPVNRHLEY